LCGTKEALKPVNVMRRAIASPAVMERFLEDCAEFVEAVTPMTPMDDADLGQFAHVVFEGAQGLLLDQRSRDFLHVTRSNTGIQNMAAIARLAGIGRIEATYATRAYLTRHGAGPMPDQRDISQWFDAVDETNVPNPWQNSIRYGLLDLELLAAQVAEDVAKADGVKVGLTVAVSCLDQALGDVEYLVAGIPASMPSAVFASEVAQRVGVSRSVGVWSAGRELHPASLAA